VIGPDVELKFSSHGHARSGVSRDGLYLYSLAHWEHRGTLSPCRGDDGEVIVSIFILGVNSNDDDEVAMQST